MERSATAFTAADRIGQLAVQVNDIDDSRRMLETHRRLRRRLRAGPAGAGRSDALGRTGGQRSSRPRCGTFLRADDARAPALRPRGDRGSTPAAARGRDPRRRRARRGAERLDAITGVDGGRRGRAHARSSGSSARSGARSTPAARATTRSPRRSGSASATRARRRTSCCAAFARAMLDRAGGGGGDADARVHAPPARDPGHGRPPPARLGRDAGARPGAVRRSPPRRRGRRRSAPARSRARRCRCRRRPNPMRNTIDAVADRDFALDYLYACAVLFTHLSRIGEELVLWTTSGVRLRAPARGGRDRARR